MANIDAVGDCLFFSKKRRRGAVISSNSISRFVAVAAALLSASCSFEGPRQSIESAAGEYLTALSDGTFDGFLAHEQSQHQQEQQEKLRVPSDAWAQRQSAMRQQAKVGLQNRSQSTNYSDSGKCAQIIRPGAHVAVREIRPISPTQWQVFYDISFQDDTSSPIILRPGNKSRFLQSGTVSVAFQRPEKEKILIADSNCISVPNSFKTWPVPAFSADDAMRLVKASNAIPAQKTIDISGTVYAPSTVGNWNRFIQAGDTIKEFLLKYGWTVAGFERPSMGYYSYSGQIRPPASSAQWVLGGIARPLIGQNPGYTVVFQDTVQIMQTSFSATEDTAVASFAAKYSGCTPFCELWKDLRVLPQYIGGTLFYGAFGKYNPGYDLDSSQTYSFRYDWTPYQGWVLRR